MDDSLLRGTYGTALGNQMLGYALSRGFRESDVLRIMQTDRRTLTDPDARLSFGPALRFWEHVVRTLGDPAVPIQFAEMISPGDLGVVGFAAITSTSVREGIHRAVRYYALLADTARILLSEEREGLRLQFVRVSAPGLGMRVMNENSIASILHVLRLASGLDFDPVEVAFRHPAPNPVATHRRFFRTVRFEADWEGLIVPTSVLDRPPAGTKEPMGAFFERYATSQLRGLRASQSFTDRVRSSILELLSEGEPRMASVAQRLGTTERTLRRRLEEEQVSFSELIDEVRRTAARTHLMDPRVSVSDLAFLLGFSEVSAFSRAFKRWYGTSPRAFRQHPS
ncbi:Transcriptional regulator, AraC family [Myxococcus hansupus]|uniref:Transcriptional regulator, AraC family n=1 Tax=Pseudomyxococcus hansupus TaxID=1297742 RepID=A0A0H4WYM8_9BACT|nr:AraC family transcriptional regulator [Myxococcus hansupus]AKQ67914.1 Transcriptional regulator, AraC family [Myxococcus hansupus]